MTFNLNLKLFGFKRKGKRDLTQIAIYLWILLLDSICYLLIIYIIVTWKWVINPLLIHLPLMSLLSIYILHLCKWNEGKWGEMKIEKRYIDNRLHNEKNLKIFLHKFTWSIDSILRQLIDIIRYYSIYQELQNYHKWN